MELPTVQTVRIFRTLGSNASPLEAASVEERLQVRPELMLSLLPNKVFQVLPSPLPRQLLVLISRFRSMELLEYDTYAINHNEVNAGLAILRGRHATGFRTPLRCNVSQQLCSCGRLRLTSSRYLNR